MGQVPVLKSVVGVKGVHIHNADVSLVEVVVCGVGRVKIKKGSKELMILV